MAIVLKEGKTFNPDISTSYDIDMTGSNYYGVIDEVMYDKYDKTCHFSVAVYGSDNSRIQKGSVTHRFNFTFTENAFEIQIGNDGYSISQAYNKALETLTDWKSDEA